MNTKRSKLPSHGAGGFSLIEVALAVGVVAFAFVSLMGLLPVGLQVFRNTIDASVRSQIVQHVTTDALQTNFDVLTSSSNALTNVYFDDQGNEVAQTGSIYSVQVQVTPSTALPSPSSSGTNSDLATLLIQIADNPAQVANPFSGSSNLPISVATTFVARNEHQ